MNKKISIILKILFILANIGVFLFVLGISVIGTGLAHWKIRLDEILPSIAIMSAPLLILFIGYKKGLLPKVIFAIVEIILFILLLLFIGLFVYTQNSFWHWF